MNSSQRFEQTMLNWSEELEERLNNLLPSHPHLLLKTEEDLTLDEWGNKHFPFLWKIVETDEEHDLVVLADSAYGYIAALYKDNLEVGRKFINLSNSLLILNRDYFSTTHYIWGNLRDDQISS